MPYKMVHVSDAEMAAALASMPGLEDVGTYNRMPWPWVEISEDEFLHRCNYGIDRLPRFVEHRWASLMSAAEEQEWRQRPRVGHGTSWWPPYTHYSLWWLRDEAYAATSHPSWTTRQFAIHQGVDVSTRPYGVIYTGQRKFYRIGCVHQDVGKNIGHCLTRYTCQKCGRQQEVDSSD